MNYISRFVKIPCELDIKNVENDGVGIILDYVPDKLYQWELVNNTRFFRPYIGNIQDILLIGISWLAVPEIEENFLSNNPEYGIVIQVDFPKKGQFTIIYRKIPKKEFERIDTKTQILVEIILVEDNSNKTNGTGFWGSLDKSIFPERRYFDEKFAEIHKILQADHGSIFSFDDK